MTRDERATIAFVGKETRPQKQTNNKKKQTPDCHQTLAEGLFSGEGPWNEGGYQVRWAHTGHWDQEFPFSLDAGSHANPHPSSQGGDWKSLLWEIWQARREKTSSYWQITFMKQEHLGKSS